MAASRGCVNQVSQELHHTAHHVTRHHTPLHNKATDVYAFFWRKLSEPGSRYVAQAGLKLVILLPQIPELWNYRDAPPRGCVGFQTTQMSYTPSELTRVLLDSPPSPSTTWLPVLQSQPSYHPHSHTDSPTVFRIHTSSLSITAVPGSLP